MNFMWGVIFFLLPVAGMAYTCWHVFNILPFAPVWRWVVVALMVISFLVMIFNFLIGLDRWPMALSEVLYEVGNSVVFILLYVVMLFAVLDIGRFAHVVPRSFLVHSWVGTLSVFVVIFGLFLYGNIHYGHKYRQPVVLKTEKALPRDLKIVMISDLHLGYHNRVEEFRRWIDLINAEQPDLVLIGGDIIDGSIRAIRNQKMESEFHRLQAPVYACLGNHEYYSGRPAAIQFYHDAGIHLLVDSVAEVMGINIVGRDDRTNSGRESVTDLMQKVRHPERYTILLDHQPYHLEAAERSDVDFQFSGHTHYGQVWPISWIEDAIYEDAYGPLVKGRTHYFVSSGIGIWGGKFRIGTRSEYLVATLTSNRSSKP